MTNRFKAYAAVSSAAFIWGVSFVATKAALENTSPNTLLFLRFALASCIVLPLWFYRGREKLRPSHLPLFMLLGLLEPGLYYLFETWGLVHTTATAAALIIAVIPVLVTLLAALVLEEKVSPLVLMGIVLTLVGVVGLIWQDRSTLHAGNMPMLGNILILAAAFCAACFTILSRRLRSHYHAWTLTSFQITFAALFFLPFAIREWRLSEFSRPPVEPSLSILFLALFATVFAFLLYNYSLGILEASRVSIFINVIPLVTVVSAWLILAEEISWMQAAGGTLILAGIALTSGASEPSAGASKWKSLRTTLFRDLLQGRHNKVRFPFVPAQKNVKGSGATIPRASGSEG